MAAVLLLERPDRIGRQLGRLPPDVQVMAAPRVGEAAARPLWRRYRPSSPIRKRSSTNPIDVDWEEFVRSRAAGFGVDGIRGGLPPVPSFGVEVALNRTPFVYVVLNHTVAPAGDERRRAGLDIGTGVFGAIQEAEGAAGEGAARRALDP